MHTMMLKAIQHPAHVDDLICELVQSLDCVPSGTYQISDRSALPPSLQTRVQHALNKRQSWASWLDDQGHAWLFIAYMLLEPSRARGVPVLHVEQYREDGRMADSGQWISEHEGSWARWTDTAARPS
jgi:hypothetical protein